MCILGIVRFSLTYLHYAFSLVASVGLAGCATGSENDACTRSDECAGVCVNGRCTAERDAALPDAMTRDANTRDTNTRTSDTGGGSDGAVEVDSSVRDSGGSDVAAPRDTGVRVDVPMGPCSAAGCVGSVLRDGARAWTDIAVDATSAFAPPSPVVGAFDIESLDIAYVLTGTTFHILRLSDGVYVASGSLASRFPGLVGLVLSVTSIPAGHAGSDPNLEGITFAMRDEVFLFDYNISTERFRQTGGPIDYGDDWLSAFAPDRNAVLGGWLALENEDGWVPGSPRLSCAASADSFATYVAYLADGQVHLYDAGHCFDFVARIPVAFFAPFQHPGAPDFARIGGSFYHQGDLWIINARPR